MRNLFLPVSLLGASPALPARENASLLHVNIQTVSRGRQEIPDLVVPGEITMAPGESTE